MNSYIAITSSRLLLATGYIPLSFIIALSFLAVNAYSSLLVWAIILSSLLITYA